jgi:hypothetical protein
LGRRRNGGASARDLPVALVAHACTGRTRLSFPDRKEQRSFFEQICDATLRLPGVRQVEGRPATGSLIVAHDGTTEALLEAAHESGVFIVPAPPSGPGPASETPEWQSLLGMLFKDASSPTGAARAASIVALLGMALVQASRGQIMPPATTALWYAMSLLLGSGAPSGAGGGEGAGDE